MKRGNRQGDWQKNDDNVRQLPRPSLGALLRSGRPVRAPRVESFDEPARRRKKKKKTKKRRSSRGFTRVNEERSRTFGCESSAHTRPILAVSPRVCPRRGITSAVYTGRNSYYTSRMRNKAVASSWSKQ